MRLSSFLVASVLVFTARSAAAQASAPGERETRAEPRIDREQTAREASSRDTIMNVAAAIPARGVVRLSTSAGVDRSRVQGNLGGAFGAGLLWAIGSGVGAEVAALARDGGAYPDVALRWQPLEQERAGIDLMTAARYGTFGTELPTVSGGQVGAQIAVGRSFGRLRLVANAMIARGVIVRTDVDAIGGAAALVDLVEHWRIGVDGRVRTELEDSYKTVEDEGRPAELKGGLISAHQYGRAYLQILGGWQVPRGLAAAGPIALVTAAVDF